MDSILICGSVRALINRGTCLDTSQNRVHECVYSASVRCVCFGEYWSESFTTKRMSFSFSFVFLFFCHEYSLALEVVLGLAFFYNRCMSPDRVREKKRVSGSSQMNLCKWLFDNEASLICQLCLYKQTLPCKASQSLESADMTEEIKRVFFVLFF